VARHLDQIDPVSPVAVAAPIPPDGRDDWLER